MPLYKFKIASHKHTEKKINENKSYICLNRIWLCDVLHFTRVLHKFLVIPFRHIKIITITYVITFDVKYHL